MDQAGPTAPGLRPDPAALGGNRGQWLGRLFRWASDAVILFDRDFAIVDVNPAAERLFGWTLDEVRGRSAADLVAPDHLARLRDMQLLTAGRLRAASATAGEDDQPIDFEWTINRPDGTDRDVGLRVSAIRTDEGDLIGYGVIFQDVTAANRATTLRSAMALLSSTALQMRDVRAVFDAAVATPTACLGADHVTLFELLPGGLEVLPVAHHGWPDTDTRSFRLEAGPASPFDEVLTTGRPLVLEHLALTPEDTIPATGRKLRLPVGSAVSVRISVGDQPWGVLTASWSAPRRIAPEEVDMLQTVANVVATVIERERNDLLRLQAERTLRLGALGQMAAGVAHDLANVLAGIEATVAAEAARPGVSPESAVTLGRVLEEAQHGHGIIDEILDFARLAPIDPEPLDLGSWLADQRPALESILPPAVPLVIETPDEGPLVCGDPCGLRRIVTNLVANAGDAVAAAGPDALDPEVRIRLVTQLLHPGEAAEVEGMAPGPWARLDVVDTGPGIDPEVLPRVFEPFFSTKKHRRGTGLGLAQVHGLALQHGGHVSVTAPLGLGATFSIWFPVWRPGEPC